MKARKYNRSVVRKSRKKRILLMSNERFAMHAMGTRQRGGGRGEGWRGDGPFSNVRMLGACTGRGQCADVGSRVVVWCHLASRATRKHMGVLSPACVCFHLIRGSGSIVCLRITVESADSTIRARCPL